MNVTKKIGTMTTAMMALVVVLSMVTMPVMAQDTTTIEIETEQDFVDATDGALPAGVTYMAGGSSPKLMLDPGATYDTKSYNFEPVEIIITANTAYDADTLTLIDDSDGTDITYTSDTTPGALDSGDTTTIDADGTGVDSWTMSLTNTDNDMPLEIMDITISGVVVDDTAGDGADDGTNGTDAGDGTDDGADDGTDAGDGTGDGGADDGSDGTDDGTDGSDGTDADDGTDDGSDANDGDDVVGGGAGDSTVDRDTIIYAGALVTLLAAFLAVAARVSK
ncbi:hypothetical protein [Halorubrum sp. DTA46]|uniref:hypothetical protein n=1 Tax=Halorubrum sp. DTA46 TaxID=3402162 RepID=UPI003AAB8AD7